MKNLMTVILVFLAVALTAQLETVEVTTIENSTKPFGTIVESPSMIYNTESNQLWLVTEKKGPMDNLISVTDKVLLQGSGIEEAPEDGKLYGRKDGEWEEISIEVPPLNNVVFIVQDTLPDGNEGMIAVIETDAGTLLYGYFDGEWNYFLPVNKRVGGVEFSTPNPIK